MVYSIVARHGYSESTSNGIGVKYLYDRICPDLKYMQIRMCILSFKKGVR